MCCNTKEKIALAVKELMRQKSIRKITVQDIMDYLKAQGVEE